MAYSNPLDPTTPSATALRSEGDDRIREAKAALIERLLTVFQDLNVDPLAFIAGIIPTAALANLAVSTAKLADNGVTTPKILDSNVTTPKLADDAVTFAKLLTAMRTKMPQIQKATVQFISGYTWSAATNYDYITSIPVPAGNDWTVSWGAPNGATFPSDKVVVSAITAGGFINIRVRNTSSSNVILAETYTLSVYLHQPLS